MAGADSITFPLVRSLIEDLERAISLCDQLDPTRRVPIHVGHISVRKIAIAGIIGSMQLPDILERGDLVESFVSSQCTTFLYPVIHDGNPRLKGGEGGRIRRIRAAVMRDQVYIDRAYLVVRTSEIEQRLTGEITHIQESKFTVLNQHSR